MVALLNTDSAAPPAEVDDVVVTSPPPLISPGLSVRMSVGEASSLVDWD